MSKKILMHVAADGSTKVEAQGFEGGTCVDATAPFESMFTKTERPRIAVGECNTSPDEGERVF